MPRDQPQDGDSLGLLSARGCLGSPEVLFLQGRPARRGKLWPGRTGQWALGWWWSPARHPRGQAPTPAPTRPQGARGTRGPEQSPQGATMAAAPALATTPGPAENLRGAVDLWGGPRAGAWRGCDLLSLQGGRPVPCSPGGEEQRGQFWCWSALSPGWGRAVGSPRRRPLPSLQGDLALPAHPGEDKGATVCPGPGPEPQRPSHPAHRSSPRLQVAPSSRVSQPPRLLQGHPGEGQRVTEAAVGQPRSPHQAVLGGVAPRSPPPAELGPRRSRPRSPHLPDPLGSARVQPHT